MGVNKVKSDSIANPTLRYKLNPVKENVMMQRVLSIF